MKKKKDSSLITAEDIRRSTKKSVSGIRRIIKEFKDFAMRGNMLDMAVGIVIGTAFTAMINSLINNILMPAIVYFVGGADYKSLTWHGINYGQAITDIINFFILAAVIFLVVKAMNAIAGLRDNSEGENGKNEEALVNEVILLKEIRDILKDAKS